MIKASEAIAVGRKLLGTPYSELDCIGYIKKIIRTASGGEKGYTTSGTNTLWRSYEASGKYRDLTWRKEGVDGALAGMLAFKRDGADVHHVGLCTGEGTVLHSSSAKGMAVETDLNNGQWSLLARHRLIEVAGDAVVNEPTNETVLYRATVVTQKDPLRLRMAPRNGLVLASIPRGEMVDVLSDTGDGWPMIRYGEVTGYVSAEYLQRINEASTPSEPAVQPDPGGSTPAAGGSTQEDPNLGTEQDGKVALWLSPEAALEVLRAASAALYAD